MNGYDKATIERIRAGVQQQVDLLKRWEAESVAAGEHDKAKRHRWAAFIIEHKLLGAGEGCVITTLDARWMDDDFRAMMSGTHVKHDNIPVKIDGVEVGRANVRVFYDHIEVDVLEMVSPLKDLLGGFGPVSVAPKGGDA